MKTNFEFMENMTIHVHALNMTADIWMGNTSLNKVLEFIQDIFNDNTMFVAECIDSIYVTNSKTGELIVVCEPDEDENDEDY